MYILLKYVLLVFMKPIHVIAENETLMKEWDYEKNNALSLDPFFVGMASHKKAWWKCSEGHSWYAMISDRSGQNRGCPYCAHQIPIKGENDLQTIYPEIAKEWHQSKNKDAPSDYLPGSHKMVWWICSKGHEYQSIIKNRTKGVGCPYCAGKKVLVGFNDLGTKKPDLASEWHPTKNGNLKPSDVTPFSNKKVWWICTFGHEYESTVNNRSNGRGCKKCSDFLRTSFPEQAFFYYVKQVFPDAINCYKEIFEKSMELDIYIPSIKTGIEYDGVFWHDKSNLIREEKKYRICQENHIRLFRIKEGSFTGFAENADSIWYIPPNCNDNSLSFYIAGFLMHLTVSFTGLPDVDVGRDRKKIMEYLYPKKNSFLSLYPDIASEWDYEKNIPIRPEFFAVHSNEKVFWKCKSCGCSWEATIADRTRPDKPTGCPACGSRTASEKRIKSYIEKTGSFADNYPELLEEWDYEKNTDITPEELTPSSAKKVHWKCKKCGYEWISDPQHRTKGRGCPYCGHRVVITGKNDLATLFPYLMKEWDFEKNNQLGLDPTKLPIRTAKKAYWKCSICSYEWMAHIYHRTKGRGCPNFRKHKYFWDEKQYSLFDDSGYD